MIALVAPLVLGTAGCTSVDPLSGSGSEEIESQIVFPVTYVGDPGKGDLAGDGSITLNADGTGSVVGIPSGKIATSEGRPCVEPSGTSESGPASWTKGANMRIEVHFDGGETLLAAHSQYLGSLDWERVAIVDCNNPELPAWYVADE